MLAMMVLVLCAQLTQPPPEFIGTIEGTVINGTSGKVVGASAEVVLRVEIDGQFIPVTETTTDDFGAFRFENVPIVAEAVYLPGANWGHVHYPGHRVHLTPNEPCAKLELQVFDERAEPCPLRIRRHAVVVRAERGALHVQESLQIENPSRICYVGQSHASGESPITLRLSIAPNFERATFCTEFLGRRFAWQDEALVTRVPWPPGVRNVEFSYVLPHDAAHGVWRRRVDLPCDVMEVTALSDNPRGISCQQLTSHSVTKDQVTFVANGELLPGQTIELFLEGLPIAATVPLRAIAVITLAGAVLYSGRQLLGRAHEDEPLRYADGR